VTETRGAAESADDIRLASPRALRRLANGVGGERLRFLIVGGVNTAVGYGAFALIYYLWGSGLGYIGTLLCAHLVASSLAFFLYRRWVFRVRGRPLLDYVRFQGIYAVSLAVNIALLPAFVELLGWNVYLAQAVVLVVTVIGSFLGHKFFSFRRPRTSSPQDTTTTAP
jgi:putative flippase GtrA